MMINESVVSMWATAISTNSSNGRKMFWRYAKEFRPVFDRQDQPHRIIIVWKYQSDTGQPLSEDHRMMNQLEDALETTLDGRFATLALVSTGENLREWTYYAKSEDEFLQRLNIALYGMAEFPIEIHTADDPAWSMYQEFKSGVKE